MDTVRVEVYRGQVINGVLAQVHLTKGPVCPEPILWLFIQFLNV